MLSDEDAINDVNPFVIHDFSLPGSVRQTGDFANFSEINTYSGLPEPEKSVFCDYGLCKDATSSCSINRNLQPKRNIDYGFTKEKNTVVDVIKIGVTNNPNFSIIGAWILLMTLIMIVYNLRR